MATVALRSGAFISRNSKPLAGTRRELVASMIAGVLLYCLNLVSPVYLAFRPGLDEDWSVLVQPLLIGFIGGWGGIHLLVISLNQIFRDGEAKEVVREVTQTSSRNNAR